jgi:hypothetical protein
MNSTTLTWLHLSDLHARLRDDWDFRGVSAAMVHDLQRLQAEHGLRPDFVFFTGDAAYGAAGGEKMADQYVHVRAFLESVCTAFTPEIPLRHVYLVPGNHDVDRNEITPGETEWLRNPYRKLEDIIPPMRDNTKQWRSWVERLAAYRNFLTTCNLLHLEPDDAHLLWSDAREIAGLRVGVAGFNSSWSCVDKYEKGKLWCGIDWQVARVQERLGPVTFSFALIHHPGNWFTPHEDPALMRRLRKDFPIVLHGHEHQHWVDVDSDQKIIVSAGACYDCSWMPPGYNMGRIDIDKQSGGIFLRQWDPTGRGWVERNIAGKTENGIWPLRSLTWLKSSKASNIAMPESPVIELKTRRANRSAAENYTRRYCQHIIEQHDILELFGCDIPRELQRHQLSVAYVSLNLSPETDETPKTRRQSSAPRVDNAVDDPIGDLEIEDDGPVYGAGIEHVLEEIAEGGRLMIRGPAGAGKSTLLRWCAIDAAKHLLELQVLPTSNAAEHAVGGLWRQLQSVPTLEIAASWRQKVPVLIRLRDCEEGKLPAANDLPHFVAKHLPSAPTGWMTDLFESGRVLVLLDGVDEVHRDQRAQLADEIAELINTYQDCTYVVTTRPGAVEHDWLKRLEFTEARVEPMGRVDREEFIDKWYRSAALELKHRPRPGEDLKRTAMQLKVELTDQPELGVLASNPLLCAMICALYRERQERLPETPAELCEALVMMLLHRRERETPGLGSAHFGTAWRALQYPQKKGLLAELAWHMVREGQSAIPTEAANRIVASVIDSIPGRSAAESSDVLQGLVERSGLLRPAGDDRIDFLHNTLKEYLAAGRAIEVGDWRTLAERADDPAWQPVLLFTLALAPEPFSSNIVRQLLTRVPAPGQKLASRSGTPSKRVQRKIAQTNARDFFLVRCRSAATRLAAELSAQIDELTERLFPPDYMHQAEALAQLGPRILMHAAAELMDPKWWKRQDARSAARCLRLLRLIGGARAATAIAAIPSLPAYASQVTGEWMLACSELCEGNLPWPFSVRDRVWFSNTHVSDLRPLGALVDSLRFVYGAWSRVSDLRPFREHRVLEYLQLTGTRVTDLAPLAAAYSLRILSLNRTRVTDLTPLNTLHKLQILHLSATRVTGLNGLEHLESLQHINLDRTAVFDLRPLATLTNLRFVSIQQTKVSDLEPLRKLPMLSQIEADGSHLSRETAERFRRERPDVKLIYR